MRAVGGMSIGRLSTKESPSVHCAIASPGRRKKSNSIKLVKVQLRYPYRYGKFRELGTLFPAFSAPGRCGRGLWAWWGSRRGLGISTLGGVTVTYLYSGTGINSIPSSTFVGCFFRFNFLTWSLSCRQLYHQHITTASYSVHDTIFAAHVCLLDEFKSWSPRHPQPITDPATIAESSSFFEFQTQSTS